jgi:hypothetical protein
MEQTYSWEANTRLVSQDIPHLLWNQDGLLQSATGHHREPEEFSPHPPALISLKSVIILSSQVPLSIPKGLFPSGLPTKIKRRGRVLNTRNPEAFRGFTQSLHNILG